MRQATRLELSATRHIAYHRLAAKPECRDQPGLIFLCGFQSAMDGNKARFLHEFAAERGRAFVRFDYTGHGRSSGRFEDGTIGQWADDAAEVLGRLTDGPQILIGSSMGGWIALLLARRFPERIAGLIGIAAAPDFTAGGLAHRLSDAERALLAREGRVAVASRYSDEPYVYTQALIDDGNRNLVLTTPLRIDAPVRLLHGTADPDVDQDVGRCLLAHIDCPDATLTLVKDGDHRLSDLRSLQLLTASIDNVTRIAGS